MDIIAGGFWAFYEDDDFAPTIPYQNDDITWCVAKAKLRPLYLVVMKLYTTEIWILSFCTGYSIALIFFLMVPFGKNEKKIDFNYSAYLVIFPLLANLPTIFQPKTWSCRIFFVAVSFCGLVFFAYSFAQLQYTIMNAFKYRYEQISSFEDLRNGDFVLMGSNEALKQLKLRNSVSIFESPLRN